MDITVNITPEQIEQYIAQSVMDSSIGKRVKEIVESQIKGMGRSWDNALTKAINEEIIKVVRRMIIEEYEPQIQEAARELLAQKVRGDFISNLISRTMATYD